MRSTKRESLLDVMVARTAGVIELHLRNGNKALALEAVEYAFKELEISSQPVDASKMANDTHLVATSLNMREVLALERIGLTTVGDVRKAPVEKIMAIPGVARHLAIKIYQAVGLPIPHVLSKQTLTPLDLGINKTRKGIKSIGEKS